MESARRMMKFQNDEAKKSIVTFWLVVVAVNIFSYILNYYISMNTNAKMFFFYLSDEGTMSVAGANASVIFLYLIGYGMSMYYESFPIAIGFSATRKEFYESVIMSNVITCLCMAMIFGLLINIDRFIISAIGRQPMVDFGMFNIVDDNILFVIFSLFIGYLTLLSIFNFNGVLLYKVGWLKFLIGYSAITIAMISNRKLAREVWNIVEKTLTTRITPTNLIYLLIIIITLYILGYLVIRRTNIKYSKC